MSAIARASRRIAAGVVGQLTALGLFQHAVAQAPTIATIRAEPTCATCRIDLAPLRRLTAPSDSIGLGVGSRPVMMSRGETLVLRGTERGQIAYYDANGKFKRLIGRAGKEPGEFLQPAFVSFGVRDTVFVYDETNRRISVLSPPPALSFIRTIPTTQSFSLLATQDRLLISGAGVDNDFRAVHLLNMSGSRVGSLGPRASAAGNDFTLQRFMAVDSRGDVWAAHGREWVVDKLNLSDRSSRTFEYIADWFPPATTAPRLPPWEAKPLPMLSDISFDGRGGLWYLIRRGNRDWRATTGAIAGKVNGSLASLFESVLVGVEPTTGEVLATRVVSGGVLGFAGPGVVWEVVEGNDGVAIQLWNVLLVR